MYIFAEYSSGMGERENVIEDHFLKMTCEKSLWFLKSEESEIDLEDLD